MPEITTLADELAAVLGADAVRTDNATLDSTSHDTWPMTTKWSRQGRHPYRADMLVVARRVDDVVTVLRMAGAAAVPVTTRALGSSVTGQPLPTSGGIVLDVSGLEGDTVVDEVDLTVTVPASRNGGELESKLNAVGYTLGHCPQSLHRSSVGGWLATLATGQFSSYYGGIEDLVQGYTVVLADGHVALLTASPRKAMGPDLRQLFIGSEGTLGVIVSVTLKIFPVPEARLLETYAFPSVRAGLTVMREQAALGLRPFLLRFYDTDEARHAMQDPMFDSPVMFAGTQGEPRLAAAELEVLGEIIARHGGRTLGPSAAEGWMTRRFDFSSIENLLAEDGGFGETVEVAHTWRHIEGLHGALKRALAPLADEVLGHFSHVYTQGTSLYMILLGRVADDDAAVARLEQIWRVAMEVCLERGAELSHHHGGGLIRSPYAKRSLGTAHPVLQRLKNALDPEGVLNPGKLGLQRRPAH
ncbi:MAG: FAD-binding oxidoreductase [Solirubrobacteraceae bacterium]